MRQDQPSAGPIQTEPNGLTWSFAPSLHLARRSDASYQRLIGQERLAILFPRVAESSTRHRPETSCLSLEREYPFEPAQRPLHEAKREGCQYRVDVLKVPVAKVPVRVSARIKVQSCEYYIFPLIVSAWSVFLSAPWSLSPVFHAY